MDYKELLCAERAQLIRDDDVITEVEPKNGTDFQLEEMYRLMQVSMIEHVYLPNGKILVVDEEGALKSLRHVNWTATRLVCEVLQESAWIFSDPFFIFGNALLIDENQVK